MCRLSSATSSYKLTPLFSERRKVCRHLMLSLSVYSSLDCSAPPWNTLITADWTLVEQTDTGQRSTSYKGCERESR